MIAPLFALEQVTVEIDGVPLVRDLQLEVPEGGITVVLGPSGAGKSTLLRLCNRLEVPTSGEVRFRGTPVAELDPLELRRRVGMVFQRPTAFAGSVEMNLRVASPNATDAELASALERVGLATSFLTRTADDLSGGEAQRMCLARTLLTSPEVLLMDEPTSSLDTAATKQLEWLTAELARDRMVTVIWVTHDLAQAARLADHRIVLARGRVATAHEIAHYEAGEELHEP